MKCPIEDNPFFFSELEKTMPVFPIKRRQRIIYCSVCKKAIGKIKTDFALLAKHPRRSRIYISLYLSQSIIICRECIETKGREILVWLKRKFS